MSKSLWMETPTPVFPSLNTSIEADICIVGSGIAGLTSAYRLAKEGKSVVVIDQGAIGEGETARTTAHLTWVLDNRYSDLEKLFSEDEVRLAAESHYQAINHIENIVKEEAIVCDFERLDGYLFFSSENSKDLSDKEFSVIQKIGREVHRASNTQLSGPCLHFPNQAQFHILKYLQGLIKGILKYRGQIFSQTHAVDFEEGELCSVSTETGAKITCQAIIVATCTPVNDRFFIHTKQSAYRTYVIAGSVLKGAIPKGLYWDTADPYHYIRLQKHPSDPSLDWLIIGGEDHKTGQDDKVEEKYLHLEKWAKERFPINEIEYRWSGQVYEPVDSLAYIGKNPGNKNVYIATGHSGNGMTYGTISGMLIPDLILGIANPWEKLYEPSRKTISAAADFIEENLNTAKQYGDWFTPGEIKEIDLLVPGEGAILREGLKKIAVYKDKENKLHTSSAFCPHLGGCVRWNPGEKSWDCPCHGSRFDGCGQVICGPAISSLRQ